LSSVRRQASPAPYALGKLLNRDFSVVSCEEVPPPGDDTFLSTTKVRDILKLKSDLGRHNWIGNNETVYTAVSKMKNANVGALLVYNFEILDANSDGIIQEEELENSVKAIEGIVSERDILQKMVSEKKDGDKVRVYEIMTKTDGMSTVSPTQSVRDAMNIMIIKNVRHIPVVNGDVMEGMVSIRDVVDCVLRESREHVETLNSYIHSVGY